MEKEKGSRKRTRRAPQLPHWVPMSHHVPSGPMALLAVTGGTTQDISHPASLTLHSAPPAVSPTSPHIPPTPHGLRVLPMEHSSLLSGSARASVSPRDTLQSISACTPRCNPQSPTLRRTPQRGFEGGREGRGGWGQLKPHCRILAERSTPGPPQSRCSAGRKCENHSVGAEERTERGRGGVG